MLRSLSLILNTQILGFEIICSLQGVEFAAEIFVEFGTFHVIVDSR